MAITQIIKESAVQTIYLMNINQNFKNQLWALQNGNNARIELENELVNRDFGISSKFGDLVISTLLVDTIPEKTDTLLNYVLQNGTLSERVTISPVFVEYERYSDAQSNLNEVASLSLGNEKMQDFIDLQQINILLKQTPDSLRDSILVQNELWLWNIADDSSHFCQSDAISLLQVLHDSIFPVPVYVGSTYSAKKLLFSDMGNTREECLFDLYPNPASNILYIKLTDSEHFVQTELRIYDLKGILIYKQSILPENNLLQINVSKWIYGKYFIEVVNEDGLKCVKSFNVN